MFREKQAARGFCDLGEVAQELPARSVSWAIHEEES